MTTMACKKEYVERKAEATRVLSFDGLFALNQAKLQIVLPSGTGSYRDVKVEKLSATSFKLDGLLFTKDADADTWTSKSDTYSITLTESQNIGIGVSGHYVNGSQKELWSIFYPGLPD